MFYNLFSYNLFVVYYCQFINVQTLMLPLFFTDFWPHALVEAIFDILRVDYFAWMVRQDLGNLL